MSDGIDIQIDGRTVTGRSGQTILEAAEAAGVYIPRLCHRQGLSPHGSCRVCTVLANGRPQAACTTPIAPGMVIENEVPKVRHLRRNLIEMLLVEGNHFCMVCEKSGHCELQALAYRFGIEAPKYPQQYPQRDVDASHPDVFVDHNRCVLCGRCVRTSRELDGRNVFQFVGRGAGKRVSVNSGDGLGGTDLAVTDRAVEACPVGCVLKKRVGYAVPLGQRPYDHRPIGSEIEAAAK
jgi:[NiFe] hydrogenase diaphorase moiety small subunit